MKKKADLPVKICPVCNRSFSWRKKWERNWEEVRYCSERCRRNKQAGVPDENAMAYLCKQVQQ